MSLNFPKVLLTYPLFSPRSHFLYFVLLSLINKASLISFGISILRFYEPVACH